MNLNQRIIEIDNKPKKVDLIRKENPIPWNKRIFADVADDFCSEAVREILGCLVVRRAGFVSMEARGTSE